MNIEDEPVLPRRRWLAGGAAAIAGLGAAAPGAQALSLAPAALTAQTTEGPYFLPGMPQRADITEGLPGVPLELRLTVIDASRTPQTGCRVDIWQCDAAGLYSGYAGQGDDMKTSTVGRSYLRGWQYADAQGVVVFQSLYPGWYAGRTTHLHFKVVQGQQAVLISQIFLPDALSEYLYTTLPAYQRKLVRGVLNSTDGIAMMAGDTVMGAVREERKRYVASLTAVIDPQARPQPWRGGGPPPENQRSAGGPPPGFGGRPALPTPEGSARIRALVPGAGLTPPQSQP